MKREINKHEGTKDHNSMRPHPKPQYTLPPPGMFRKALDHLHFHSRNAQIDKLGRKTSDRPKPVKDLKEKGALKDAFSRSKMQGQAKQSFNVKSAVAQKMELVRRARLQKEKGRAKRDFNRAREI